jgi:hypothetical protein
MSALGGQRHRKQGEQTGNNQSLLHILNFFISLVKIGIYGTKLQLILIHSSPILKKVVRKKHFQKKLLYFCGLKE